VGEIDFLCGLARPDYALITNVGQAHLEGFGSFEGVKKAKSELYRFIERNGGLIFCNASDPELMGILENINAAVSYYGNAGASMVKGEITGSDPYLSMRISLQGSGELEFQTGLVGDYNMDNILAALAVGLHFRIHPDNMLACLSGWSTGNMRSERIQSERNILVMDAYNANPTSMKAALENFHQQEHPSKVLILGDMLELGGISAKAHADILETISLRDYRNIFLVGPIFSGLSKIPDDIHTFADVEELASWLKANPLSDCLVLLKGSRGIGLEKLRDKL
jgi:UDP-N-acetylmuramoyl-tripeptide--D-alanyl-D-alanine ligase